MVCLRFGRGFSPDDAIWKRNDFGRGELVDGLLRPFLRPRPAGNWIVVDIVRLENLVSGRALDVIEDEAIARDICQRSADRSGRHCYVLGSSGIGANVSSAAGFSIGSAKLCHG